MTNCSSSWLLPPGSAPGQPAGYLFTLAMSNPLVQTLSLRPRMFTSYDNTLIMWLGSKVGTSRLSCNNNSLSTFLVYSTQNSCAQILQIPRFATTGRFSSCENGILCVCSGRREVVVLNCTVLLHFWISFFGDLLEHVKSRTLHGVKSGAGPLVHCARM